MVPWHLEVLINSVFKLMDLSGIIMIMIPQHFIQRIMKNMQTRGRTRGGISHNKVENSHR